MSDRHTIQPYPLRLQPDLRASLEQAAKESGRSLHAEIVARLEESLTPSSKVSAYLALPSNAPIYWQESQLLAVAEHLTQTERALEMKSLQQVKELLISRIKEVFRDDYINAHQGELQCLCRGAYAISYLGRARGTNSDSVGIYIELYVIAEDPSVTGFGELPPDGI